MGMLNPITQLGEASGGGGGGLDYSAVIPLSSLAGTGFGDGLHHYDTDENATWDGTTLELAQGSMVGIDIPAGAPAALAGVLGVMEVGAIAPDINDYAFIGLQNTANTTDLTAPGAIFSERYFRDSVLTGTPASPSLSSTSTTITHGLIMGAGDSADVGCLALPNTNLTQIRLQAFFIAPSITRPRADSPQTVSGWSYNDGEPSPLRVVVWLLGTVAPAAGATIKFTGFRFLFAPGIWG